MDKLLHLYTFCKQLSQKGKNGFKCAASFFHQFSKQMHYSVVTELEAQDVLLASPPSELE